MEKIVLAPGKNDATMILDAVRSMVVCSSFADLVSVLDYIKKRNGDRLNPGIIKIWRIKNRFLSPAHSMTLSTLSVDHLLC